VFFTGADVPSTSSIDQSAIYSEGDRGCGHGRGRGSGRDRDLKEIVAQ